MEQLLEVAERRSHVCSPSALRYPGPARRAELMRQSLPEHRKPVHAHRAETGGSDPSFASDEEQRLAALRALDVLDTPPDAEFDALARAAALACDAPIALVSLVDAERQWFKANVGLPGVCETSRSISFCSYAIEQDSLYEVPDATRDPLFANNPLVTGEPGIRFYAGAPLRLRGGTCAGTLCVIDTRAKTLGDRQREILTHLARVAVQALETRHAVIAREDAAAALLASEERARRLNEERMVSAAEHERMREIGAIADALPQIVWKAAAGSRITWLSERFTEFTGVAPAAILAAGWDSVVPADDQAEIARRFRDGRRTRSAIHFEHRLWHAATGRYRYVLARANPLLDEHGMLTGWVGTSTDVDDEHRTNERDHRASKAFQLASLPNELPRVPGWTFSADYQAAQSDWLVGGDWYDAFVLNDGRIVLSVGDVIGTGLDSAVTMAAVRQSIRGAAQLYPEPTAVLDAADRALKIEQPERIVTAFVGIVEPITGFLTYASAGHPLPMYRSPDGAIIELAASGLPLGLRSELPELRESTNAHRLEPGSLLLLYTDGLSEARRDLFAGEARIRAAVAQAVAAGHENIARFVCDAVLDDGNLRDDVAVLSIAVAPTTAMPPRERSDVRSWTVRADDPATAMDVRRELGRLLCERGADETQTGSAELIFGELLGNVVRHTTGEADVVIDFNQASPVLHVLDRGKGFFFNARLPHDVMSESGRGLFIAAALARDVNVSTRPDGGSHARAVLGFSLKDRSRRSAVLR